MHVALFGGTGFVGSHLSTKLIEHNYKLSLLIRSDKRVRDVSSSIHRIINGSINSMSAIKSNIKNCDVVIYSIGILEETPKLGITFQALQFDGLKAVVDESIKAGVKKFILMSANGVKSDGTNYQASKYHAEEYLKNSDLLYTILRPSVIFGNPHGKMEFITQLYQEVIRPPIPAINFFNGFFPLKGSVKMNLYETGMHLKKAGVISAKDMTIEAAITKMMFLLSNESKFANFKKCYETSLRGEIS